jgi:hypothetical protein
MANVTVPEDNERGNKMQGWLQSDKASHQAMWQLALKHPMALAVLHFMISKLSRGTSGVIISAPAMARQMGISERSAKSATAVLRDAQFVQILKSGNTNVYIVNSKVAWQGNRGMRYASFNAQILVDEQEQQKSIEELVQENGDLIDVPLMEFDEPVEPEASVPTDINTPPVAGAQQTLGL